MCSSDLRGDFAQRFTVEGKKGVQLRTAEGVNQLLEASQSGLRDVQEVVSSTRPAWKREAISRSTSRGASSTS